MASFKLGRIARRQGGLAPPAVGAMEPKEAPTDEAPTDPATLGRLLQQKESEVSEMREQRVRALEAALQVHPSLASHTAFGR